MLDICLVVCFWIMIRFGGLVDSLVGGWFSWCSVVYLFCWLAAGLLMF